VINVYEPSSVVPQEGDPKPFLGFLSYLVPDDGDRRQLERWIATLIARPEIRMVFSTLTVSETQGVGKTTLAEILATVIGRHNCSFPSAETITNSDFNSWAAFKRLVIVPEIYAGHSPKTANKLKSMTSDETISLNEKYMKPHDIVNFVHVYGSSNSIRALKIDNEDRRWFMPGIVETPKPREYYAELRAWCEAGGYGIIAHWARNYGDYVLPGEIAPDSTTKRRTIAETYSEGERLVYQLGLKLKELMIERVMLDENGLIIPDENGRPKMIRDPLRVVLKLEMVREWLAKEKANIDMRKYGRDGKSFLETDKKIAVILRKSCELSVPPRQLTRSVSGLSRISR
jgi:hypothetical protein